MNDSANVLGSAKSEDNQRHGDEGPMAGQSGEAVVDPVCGMSVDLTGGKPASTWMDTRYHFCSTSCHDRFNVDPYFYASGNSQRKKQVAAKDTTYTCPMDPEIVRDDPGSCPICGMALEPMGGVSNEPNHELIDFTKRLWVSSLAAIPLIILTMGPMVGIPVREWMGERLALLLEFALATPVVVWAAWPF
ncbi:MAG: heavy metal-binding domain-containing protein, partial [Anderseniella sp.]